MSTILNKLLKASVLVCAVILMASVSYRAIAQCTVNKKKIGRSVKFETPDSYQYNRADGEYLAVLTHMVLMKTPVGNAFHLVIKYTASTNMAHLLHLSFKFQDSVALASNLKLIKVQKTDNPKLSTRVYEAAVSSADLELLQQKPLKAIVISAGVKRKPVSIPVNDPTFMQQQISCLQKELN